MVCSILYPGAVTSAAGWSESCPLLLVLLWEASNVGGLLIEGGTLDSGSASGVVPLPDASVCLAERLSAALNF